MQFTARSTSLHSRLHETSNRRGWVQEPAPLQSVYLQSFVDILIPLFSIVHKTGIHDLSLYSTDTSDMSSSRITYLTSFLLDPAENTWLTTSWLSSLLALSVGQRLCINFSASRTNFLTTLRSHWVLLVPAILGLVYLMWMLIIVL